MPCVDGNISPYVNHVESFRNFSFVLATYSIKIRSAVPLLLSIFGRIIALDSKHEGCRPDASISTKQHLGQVRVIQMQILVSVHRPLLGLLVLGRRIHLFHYDETCITEVRVLVTSYLSENSVC